MATNDSNTSNTQAHTDTTPNSELLELWDKFIVSPAQITRDQMETMEQRAQDTEDSRGVARRLALAILAQSAKDLVAGVQERSTAVAFADTARVIDSCVADMKALTELLESASLRCTVALCAREDMQEILDEVCAA